MRHLDPPLIEQNYFSMELPSSTVCQASIDQTPNVSVSSLHRHRTYFHSSLSPPAFNAWGTRVFSWRSRKRGKKLEGGRRESRVRTPVCKWRGAMLVSAASQLQVRTVAPPRKVPPQQRLPQLVTFVTRKPFQIRMSFYSNFRPHKVDNSQYLPAQVTLWSLQFYTAIFILNSSLNCIH